MQSLRLETEGALAPVERSYLMDYPVDSLVISDAVQRVAYFLQGNKLHHIVAINANKVWIAEHVVGLKEILKRAELVIPEYAVVWACAVLKRPVKGHVGGIMLMQALLPWLEAERAPVYFLGAKQEVLEMMVKRLRCKYPELKLAGIRSGYFDSSEEDAIVEEINRSGAEILFVAMGSPRQEFWIEKHRSKLKVRVASGVGGSFDVIAGVKKDAPGWIRHGGEWIYRLMQDPKNLWKRYMKTNPWFVYRVFHERFFGSPRLG